MIKKLVAATAAIALAPVAYGVTAVAQAAVPSSAPVVKTTPAAPATQAVAAKPAPKAVATKATCLTTEGLCLTVPATWSTTRTAKTDTGMTFEHINVGSQWTKSFFTLEAGPAGIGGYCDADAPFYTTVLKATATTATDKHGARYYAVTAIQGSKSSWTAHVFLTNDPALRTVGAKANCVGFMSEYSEGRKQDIVRVSSLGDNRTFTTAAKAKTVAADEAHRMAHNAIATARYGK